MDTRRRLLLKALTWQGTGFFVMLAIGWLVTGSVSAGGGIAIAGTISGFCAYVVHEHLWSKVSWGLKPATPSHKRSSRLAAPPYSLRAHTHQPLDRPIYSAESGARAPRPCR